MNLFLPGSFVTILFKVALALKPYPTKQKLIVKTFKSMRTLKQKRKRKKKISETLTRL